MILISSPGDKKLIARAHIEILYQLRNALFHGEVTPNEVQTRLSTCLLGSKADSPLIYGE